ncbi:PREDICTED: YEATS domain-containing protein 4 [Bactrocera latifrons]|uniref:YEATS domain-containing protein 4 n=2 Tax=Bactrocera TaxID=47832 RepID=A0A034WKC8_BACDO|nr:YEATS domain-containing protein 4 [Bactrocera dorsalis]XP_018804112.1 PREDICTED: YEATS domain-containing protein 4 [Bactrocera latifrons]XP_039963233.1 YEATS domain-containing protein 4 [Bactrocera tryoni]XP_050333899.1 YEATS domain-containing protein 4 [Bactrocera neohumeralis]
MNSLNIPTDFGPDSGGRVKGLVIVKPIVYGNIARSFGKKNEDGHTHQWKVYVKPYHNEDMSVYVKKVHFKLHESYANPNRIVTKPPYEITETGWGEFEVVIKIYFHDPTERPVTCYHILKLFQSPVVDGELSSTNLDNTKRMGAANVHLVSESYEEIVFQEPTQLMQHFLMNVQPLTSGSYTHDTDFETKKEKTLENIIDVKGKVKSEINSLKDKLKLARETIAKFKAELAKVQKPPTS